MGKKTLCGGRAQLEELLEFLLGDGNENTNILVSPHT